MYIVDIYNTKSKVGQESAVYASAMSVQVDLHIRSLAECPSTYWVGIYLWTQGLRQNFETPGGKKSIHENMIRVLLMHLPLKFNWTIMIEL